MNWLGVDVGGTFTDLVLMDRGSGRLQILKTPSTPADQSEGILAGIEKLSLEPDDLERIVHGTTVATNTALESDGANLAVLATRGHGDVLVVGRGNRMIIYNIKAPPNRPLVARSRCFEVRERLRADGSVVTALDENDVAEIGRRLAESGVEAVAVCFLHSYANADHERKAAEILARHLPDAVITTSSEVLPEYREYERFSTTALNAYVAPRMRRYLGELRNRLGSAGIAAPLSIMTSNGGTLPAERVESMPVLSMLSGPAAGVIAAGFIGHAAGFPDIITCDMGGTSTDVCMVRGGEFGMTTEGRVAAFPVKIRQIDINTVGAGGGSIAAVSGGFLTVGPRSAKAYPGPVCFDRGGTEPTVTDANVALGRLGVDQLLGGEIRLDRAAAVAAVERLGAKLGLPAERMAEGILRIAVASMAGAIKEVSVLRGIDPRDFALLAYGGAGPLQAAAIADELGMRTVVVPPMPGNFSAFGLLVADVRRDFVRTRVATIDRLDPAEVREMLAGLVALGDEELEAAGFPSDKRRFAATLDMRYSGQSFELSVPVEVDFTDMAKLVTSFETVYRTRYGGTTGAPIEIVSYRVAAWGLADKPGLPPVEACGTTMDGARRGVRPVIFDDVAHVAPIVDRERMPPNLAIDGPAVIEEAGSSTVVPPGWSAERDRVGCLVLRRRGGDLQ
ncbi:N-methylhydantoinase A [Enhydrobacter aerosaccus]|uniref:N-methylhydantoinase A n=1 Tax=Enhydrobacter aerosaccus TaxID=225324 RepID=A0A1T4JKA5_9HYPH|nr:hydantoinase/oxoprolinase family protein [Enhydrobacter aerosaccus]SJZ30589.1 N-methylhydantoinase A [Enhydrobacter aerosaccus]